MLNVLRSDWYKLKHLKSFYMIIILCAFFEFGILADLSFYPDSYHSMFDNFLQAAFYSFSIWQFLPMLFPLALGIFICLFVTNDFSNGTMKDPVTVGHSRFHIFLSKCLVASIATVMILLVCTVVSILTVLVMFDGLTAMPSMQDVVQFATNLLLEIGLSIALAVLFTAIAFVVRHTALVMAIHFSVGMFLTIMVSTFFSPESSYYYTWLGNAMVKASETISSELILSTLSVTSLYLIVSFGIGYIVFLKRDMK